MKDVLQTLKAMGIQTGVMGEALKTNANEVMNTAGSGRGAELLPDEVLAKEIFDAIPNYGTFLPSLPGNHGSGLNKVQKVSVLGDPGFFKVGSEETTGAFALDQGTMTGTFTGEVTITQKKLYMSVDVSDELSMYNIEGAEKFQGKLKEKIAGAAARTIEAAIINGDTEVGATGNVNLDDDTPTAGTYYLGWDGLRKNSIVTDTNTVNVGTFEVADLISAMNGLGDYFADPASCMWLWNRASYNKATGVQAFYDSAQRGMASTLSGKAITNIQGADVFVARDLPKTEADGKVSTTAGNNTLGQFLLFWKPAVQYGFGNTLQLKVFDMGYQGYQLQGWFYFGFGLVSKKAGVTDSICTVARNLTL